MVICFFLVYRVGNLPSYYLDQAGSHWVHSMGKKTAIHIPWLRCRTKTSWFQDTGRIKLELEPLQTKNAVVLLTLLSHSSPKTHQVHPTMKQTDELQGDHGVGVSPAAFRAPEGGDAGTRPLTLPPNTSLSKFQDFMRSIADIVGSENATVVSSDAELQKDHYLDPSKAHDVGVT